MTPATVVAKCDGKYDLDAKSPSTNTKYGWHPFDLPKGATVGFRRQPDGSLVAVAGEQIMPIPDEPAAWTYTPTPVTRWDRFTFGARDKSESFASAMILTPLIAWAVITGGEVP